MAAIDEQLDRLLSMVAERIDPDRCREVDERYRAALAWRQCDHPPLVVQEPFGEVMALPEPWAAFTRYSYRRSFDDPRAMMQNQILSRIVPGLLLDDDNPLAIRNDHGTIQIASLLGGEWMMHEDGYPWIKPDVPMEKIEAIADDSKPIDFQGGVLPRTVETLQFYRHKFAQFPPCDEAIQISMPDLQGPMDTAEQLWGGELYLAFYETPDLLARLLTRIVDVMLAVIEKLRPLTRDRLDPEANTQHGYLIPGRLLVRNDSSIMLSPQMYAEHIRPHDQRLLEQVGTGAIHFCGNGQHLVEPMLAAAPPIRGLDFGQSYMHDLDRVYADCQPHRVALTHIMPPRDELADGRIARRYPTGVVFSYETQDISDGREVLAGYHRRRVADPV